MSIIDELKEIKNGFMAKDRHKAMEAFMTKIYYEIAPCVAFGDKVKLFKDEAAVVKFCKEKEIDIRAFKRLLDELRGEALIGLYSDDVLLTERGVAVLCVEK